MVVSTEREKGQRLGKPRERALVAREERNGNNALSVTVIRDQLEWRRGQVCIWYLMRESVGAGVCFILHC
jgi:hypothetical protein